MKLDSSASAIVTGAASGLGKATAKALRDLGVKVALFDLNAETGEAAARELGATFCHVNVMDEASVDAGFEKARTANGQERILVNCAGGGGGRLSTTVVKDEKTGEIVPANADDFEFVLGLNTVSAFRCITKSAAGMIANLELDETGERGVIVGTGSIAAIEGGQGSAAYAAAKAGIQGMTIVIARDLADYGIRCNTIMPGSMDTPMLAGLKARAPEFYESVTTTIPFPKRLGRPDEYADLAVTLCRNGYINGELIRLDGAQRIPG